MTAGPIPRATVDATCECPTRVARRAPYFSATVGTNAVDGVRRETRKSPVPHNTAPASDTDLGERPDLPPYPFFLAHMAKTIKLGGEVGQKLEIVQDQMPEIRGQYRMHSIREPLFQ